jgi:hypothetical protein
VPFGFAPELNHYLEKEKGFSTETSVLSDMTANAFLA